MKNLNELKNRIHKLNAKWWQDPATGRPIERDAQELLMLTVSEISEAMEGVRRDLMDDKLPHRKMEEVEMADAYIRLLDYAGGFGLNLFPYRGEVWLPLNKGAAMLHIVWAIVEVDTGVTTLALGYALAVIETYCQLHDCDLVGAIEAKLLFNATREDHTHEARLKQGGKKF